MAESGSLRVTVGRSGGFAGIRRESTVNAGSLAPDQAERLREIVEELDFFALPEQLGEAAGPPDAFAYTVTVEAEGRRHTARAGEASSLQPLIDFVGDQELGGGRTASNVG